MSINPNLCEKISFEWTNQPLSIETISKQYSLPVIIRAAPGCRGSNRPIILHSIRQISFAFGLALKVHVTSKSAYQSYRPMENEYVAVPLKYPGYFECLLPSDGNNGSAIVVETNIPSIVERMQSSQQSQAFYICAPLRVYALERVKDNIQYRRWRQIEPHRLILFDRISKIEYTPTEDDHLTEDDYEDSWWFCFSRQLLNRHEDVITCLLSQQEICYISCSSSDAVNLLPVGQHGSKNLYKLQSIENLVEHFTLPINLKLAQLPNCQRYDDFPGQWRLQGFRTENLAICASLSSTHLAAIQTKTPLKFVVAKMTSLKPEFDELLTRCEIFIQSFEKQLRRLVILSREPTIDTDQQRKQWRRNRSISADTRLESKSNSKMSPHYDSLIHRHDRKTRTSMVSSSSPPPPTVDRDVSQAFTYDTGSDLMEEFETNRADGAILIDHNQDLFLSRSVAKK